MKTTLIALNLLAATLMLPAMWLVHAAYVHSAASMYTELDRAQVIDHSRLEEVFPKEAKNDRNAITNRFIGPRRSS